jgi:hypothetical protein
MSYQDTDFNPNAEAERQAAERDAELARKIRSEVIRVQRGEAEADLKADRDAEAEARAEVRRAQRIEHWYNTNAWWLIFSGRILIHKDFSAYYRYFICVAICSFLSISVLFMGLYWDLKCNHLDREVRALRVRSAQMSKQCATTTSYSAIVRALAEQGVPLCDPEEPNRILE